MTPLYPGGITRSNIKLAVFRRYFDLTANDVQVHSPIPCQAVRQFLSCLQYGTVYHNIQRLGQAGFTIADPMIGSIWFNCCSFVKLPWW